MAEGFTTYRNGPDGGLDANNAVAGNPQPQQSVYTQQNPFSSQDPRLAYGGFDYGQRYFQNLYENAARDSYNRQAPTLDYNASGANADRAAYEQMHGQQAGLAGAMAQMAAGNGRSAADYQSSVAQGQNIAQQMGAAGSGRGLLQGASQYGAMQGAAQGAGGINDQYGQAKAQESWNAQHALGQTLNSMSQGDLRQRGLGQQQAQFGAQMDMQQQNLNQQRELDYTNLEQTMNAQQLGAYQAVQATQQQDDLAAKQQQQASDNQMKAAGYGAAIGMGSAAVGSLVGGLFA